MLRVQPEPPALKLPQREELLPGVSIYLRPVDERRHGIDLIAWQDILVVAPHVPRALERQLRVWALVEGVFLRIHGDGEGGVLKEALAGSCHANVMVWG